MQVSPIVIDNIPAPPEIIELVERFDQYNAKYKSNSYNETQVRREFIDPFFKALGWDVDNTQAYDERYKEVIHEDAVKVGGKTKAPDYSFRIGGVRKFFVEAKKPAVNLKENPEPTYQLRRYAWSAKLPVSILTDFEEFIVFDCTRKPSHNDSSSLGRIEYYTYKDYIPKWDEIASKYSKKAVFTGKFDDLADSLVQKKGGKGTTGIDDAFLAEIEGWREELAKNLALRNASLSVRELNLAVQKIIDRIVFLRICEDRGIEEYGQLKAKAEGKDVYKDMIELFLHADDKYNSGLFHFRSEDGMEKPDILTTSLEIDDKTLKHIIGRLYYPESPYEFSVIPADILGQVYEQFLGKVIRLTASHQAKIEEKPEVKKAGGVYYTPTYIVEYIVKNTIGKLVENKTPSEVSDLKIVDPACGSGSFLIGTYHYLLNWHIDWYITHLVPLMKEGKAATDKEVQKFLPAKSVSSKRGKKKARSVGSDYEFPIYQMSEDNWRLTSDEKKRILLNNIYGVDIDQQAVEVTKLSLLLKVLEGEKGERISKQLTITQERVLPSLHENIKCGNSLIGSGIYASVQMNFENDDEFYRINAFDWDQEFPYVFEQGGFDAVIGNPPYVRQELLKGQKEYFNGHYEVYHGLADLYAYFIEKGISLLNSDGQFSYIVANKWMRANYGKPLRSWLKSKKIEEIIDFGDLPVFKQATTYPCILRVARGEPNDSFKAIPVDTLDFSDLSEYVKESGHLIYSNSLSDDGWSLVDEKNQALLDKLMQSGKPLGEYVEGKIYRGVLTGLNKAFVIDEATKDRLIAEDSKSAEVIKPFLAGREIKRYKQPITKNYFIFTRRGIDIKKYPVILSYLQQFKQELMPKPKDWKGEWTGRKPGPYQWYEIQDSIDYFQEFEKPKIIIPAIVQSANYCFDETGCYSNDKTSIIPTNDLYLIGVLNSKVADFVIFNISSTKQGGYFEYKPMYVSKIPIRTIDPSDPEDVVRHDKMVSLVEQMLELHKNLDIAKLGSEKEMIQRRINAKDAEIDRLVYELCGLTDEEIAIVEGKSG
ncbi:putative type IV restriction endonuclease [Methanomethylovorans hollandica DSM 15978]|uniref:site-specific DNA-methyltransferase (adenine-specific) n=1 Tax=Methanomethylovorans hollandica (strain DSM 15978 / NBRC 107637 / DMS1) TaxID=867904 RepID=L0L2L1_METHD|nr:TaqI-like C-terminal specificity domain-containing protein [Methanomethylovorans hollandica]AGB50534.1 putative type IV restriction endonuclease [Methanomethylovorans hollandica DSM 15978]